MEFLSPEDTQVLIEHARRKFAEERWPLSTELRPVREALAKLDSKPDAGLSRSIRHRAEGRRPKASREGTRGGPVQAVWRLWGFDGAAGSVKDALAGIVGRGPGIAIGSRASLRLSTGRFQHARLCGAGFWRFWATVRWRRKRGLPVGGRCKAVTGVMASESS